MLMNGLFELDKDLTDYRKRIFEVFDNESCTLMNEKTPGN